MSAGYKSPKTAMNGPKEKIMYTMLIYCGEDKNQQDRLATIDVDPSSPTYSQVIHTLKMKYPGDELHHSGWNACSSCSGSATRQYLILPGLMSSRIYIIDTINEKSPTIHKVIEPEEIKEKWNLSCPHTVHCLPDTNIMISFLGDKNGNPPGGFLVLNSNFDPMKKWGEGDVNDMGYNYDFWYQPHHNILVNSEWSGPNTFVQGFSPAHLLMGKYGQKIHFWDWKSEKLIKSFDLGKEGLMPYELRFLHNPLSSHGFVVCPLSSSIWHFWKSENDWNMEKVIQIEPIHSKACPSPIPSFTVDLLISMDDRFLYTSNWMHGEVHQYCINDPHNPVLTAKIRLGGIGQDVYLLNHKLAGGPQMLQLSLDGKRLYVTNSLFSSWDDQFYPELKKMGSYMIKIECDTEKGGMHLDENFHIDFGNIEKGPFRAHEMRYPGGDCTSDIWVS
ncbi:selenium-binding [Brachionus plicatilis]|uniref:Selenium-binding n=1 Tax=Brachionus plicatilis TaxID=10195 RepID=A0A3M7PQM8_BRAPC|nr:selenium-binding [Brachionus plicatilis]